MLNPGKEITSRSSDKGLPGRLKQGKHTVGLLVIGDTAPPFTPLRGFSAHSAPRKRRGISQGEIKKGMIETNLKLFLQL